MFVRAYQQLPPKQDLMKSMKQLMFPKLKPHILIISFQLFPMGQRSTLSDRFNYNMKTEFIQAVNEGRKLYRIWHKNTAAFFKTAANIIILLQ